MEVAQRRTVVQPSSSVSFLMRRGFSLSTRQPFSPSASHSGSLSLGRSLSRSSLFSSPPRRQELPKGEQIGSAHVKEESSVKFQVFAIYPRPSAVGMTKNTAPPPGSKQSSFKQLLWLTFLLTSNWTSGFTVIPTVFVTAVNTLTAVITVTPVVTLTPVVAIAAVFTVGVISSTISP